MSTPDDRDPSVDDWFEDEDEPTQVRQTPLRRRPSLPPPSERRIPGAVLLGGLALLLLFVIVIVSLSGGDDAPAVDPGTELPTVTQPTEPTEPAETATAPTQTATETAPTTAQPLPTEEIVRPGDEGETVRALQEALATLGHDPGEADGNYGPATVEAVRGFQTASGLPPDGIAGPATLRAINEALAGQG